MKNKKLEKRLMYASCFFFLLMGATAFWFDRYDIIWVSTIGLLFYLAWAIVEIIKEAKK